MILLGWELHASYITVLCVQAVMILSSLLFMPSHSNLKTFYITCGHIDVVKVLVEAKCDVNIKKMERFLCILPASEFCVGCTVQPH